MAKGLEDDAPLGPFTERIGEVYQVIEVAEDIKAIDNLPQRRAPGADAIPADIYKRVRALISHVRETCGGILRTGHFPKALRRIYMAPLLKTGGNPPSTGLETSHFAAARHG